jgi:hypothetical protein
MIAFPLRAQVLPQDPEQPRRDLPFQFIWRKVTSAPRRGRFCTHGYSFFDQNAHTRLDDSTARSSALDGLRLKDVPVGYDDATLGQVRDQTLGYKVALSVKARLSVLGMEFAETVSDRDVRADDQHCVGEATADKIALTGKESREECETNWLQKQEIRSAGWSKDSSLATCGSREPVAILRTGES